MLYMKYRIIFASFCYFLSSGASAAGAEAASPPHTIRNLFVEGYTRRPPISSGIVHTIVGMLASDEHGNRYDFIITYFSDRQFFPKIGEHCDVTYKFEDVLHNMNGARYVLSFGAYINDPMSRKAFGARPPCGCTELPDDDPEKSRKDTTCIGDPLLAQGNVYWYKGDDGQPHLMK
jgi:hypothetical protein